MNGFSALLDTNVLLPRYLRDILFDLSVSGLFNFRWTNQIKNELINKLQTVSGLTEEKALHLIFKIDEIFPDALIPESNEYLNKFGMRDRDDEKILSAAIASNVGAIITSNLKDFPVNSFSLTGIEILKPDDFLLDIVSLAPGEVITVISRTLYGYQKPEISASSFPEYLKLAGCPEFANFISTNAALIDQKTTLLKNKTPRKI